MLSTTITYRTEPPTTTTEKSTTSLPIPDSVLTPRPPYDPVIIHSTDSTEESHQGSGSGDHAYYKGDGSNISIDQELDSDDEDYDYREYKEGSGSDISDHKYDKIEGKDTSATGDVNTLSQEEMEQLR